ncbi:hypothetical protein F4781DRAFT_441333 [Annulohypoxylon bovei var. microspora]|nr:hypothetical protein F4781DRAFT_441333 [Annulohypoxylon bovei var. microspora]
MNNNNWYPGGMPPYQQPHQRPYQQAYQQGYQQSQPQPRLPPPSRISPQPGLNVERAEERQWQPEPPTPPMQGPYMSGALPTGPSPGYQYQTGGNHLAPQPQPQPHAFHDPLLSHMSQAPYSGPNFSLSYLNTNTSPNPRPRPRPVSPAAHHTAPTLPPLHHFPQRSPRQHNYGPQAGLQPEPQAARPLHRSRHSESRPTHRQPTPKSSPKSILKQPSPQLQPQPQPQPPHQHMSSTNPLSPQLSTEQDILMRGQTELAPLTCAIIEVAAHEFALPHTAPVGVSFSLSPIDLDPSPPSSWRLGPGPLSLRTGARLLAPVLTITLPPRYPPPLTPSAELANPFRPRPRPDTGIIAAAERVVSSLRYGTSLGLPPAGGLPLRVGGELFGCAYVVLDGADRSTILASLTWVYLPSAGRQGREPLYLRVDKDGREGRRQLRRWARTWGFELDDGRERR